MSKAKLPQKTVLHPSGRVVDSASSRNLPEYPQVYLGMYIFICIHVRMNVHRYLCAYMYVHVSVRVYVYLYVCMCVCMYLCMHVFTCIMHVRMFVCMCICMYLYVHVSMYKKEECHGRPTHRCRSLPFLDHSSIYVRTNLCMNVCVYICMFVCMYVCMHACMYVPSTIPKSKHLNTCSRLTVKFSAVVTETVAARGQDALFLLHCVVDADAPAH